MKTAVYTQRGACVLLFFFFIILTAFKQKENAGCIIMVGIANQDIKCTSGSTSSTFTTAVGYKFAYSSNTKEYNAMKAKLQEEVATEYGIEKNKVNITTNTTSAFSVVIKYEKKIAGWGCMVNRYAIGYGNTAEDAEAHAAKLKKNDYSASSYTVVQTINCQ